MAKKIFLISVLLSFLMVGFCFAAGKELELIYPKIPGAEPPTTTKTALPDYLTYIFTLAIIISGILAFGAMVAGGLKYITSMGSPGALGDARDQIVSGFLGAIIILASYLILNSINPQLILPNQAPLVAKTAGIKIYSQVGCDDDADHPSLRITNNIPKLSEIKSPIGGQEKIWGTDLQIRSIKFYGGPGDVIVRLYAGESYTPAPGTPINYSDCATISDNVNSLKLEWHIPGIYLYPLTGCQGDPAINQGSPVIYQNSSATLPNFNDKTQSIGFKHKTKTKTMPVVGFSGVTKDVCINSYKGVYEDAENKCYYSSDCGLKPEGRIIGHTGETSGTCQYCCDERYAAVLHEKNDFMGACVIAEPKPATVVSEECINNLTDRNNLNVLGDTRGEDLSGRVSSITVYLQPDLQDSTSTEMLSTGNGVKIWEDKNYEGNSSGYYKENSPSPNLGSFDNKTTAVEVDGDYLAVLFDNNDYEGKCGVFSSSTPNLRDYPMGQCGWLGRGDCLSSLIAKDRK